MVKEGGIDVLEHANRLGPLKDPVALLIFSTGVEKYFHEHRPPDFPRVRTRGHFNKCRIRATPLTPEGRIGGALGVPRSLFIEDGHDETDYETAGAIPGFHDDGSPEEVVVFVHGWLAKEEAALGRMSLLRYALEKNGYTHPVVGFTWDTDQAAYEWESGKVVAKWNGPKLAQFTADYVRENPETDVRYVSNSLGAHPLFSALKTLHGSGFDDAVKSASVLGGTVPSDSVAEGGEYYDAVQNAVGDLYNYWTPRDRTLGFYYRALERADSVGGAGADGDTPSNYHDRCVDYVPDHFSFLIPERGCIDEVVDDFGVSPPESLEDTEITRSIDTFSDG
ncbi:MAG: alpha/beta hydrolase [Halobacteriales archaeon]